MQVEVVAAIVGAVGTIVGVVLGAFQEDIRNIFHFSASKKNEYLLGDWVCTWDTLAPAAKPQIKDSVQITRVRGNLVKGVGKTPDIGDWDMDGRVGYLAVSLSYSGKGEKRHLVGAIVLRKDKLNEMTGAWAQYSGSGDVISGTTVWRRAPRP